MKTDNDPNRQTKRKIYNLSTRAEKTAWERKHNKLLAFLKDIEPIEEQMTELRIEKNKIFDKIQEIRQEMVKECIHPVEHITVDTDGNSICKFCNTRIVLNDE